MRNAEYRWEAGCPQRDSAEHEEYVGARSVGSQEVKEQNGADLLERIRNRDNLNRAYMRGRANKGAPGINGMTVEEALPWLEYAERGYTQAVLVDLSKYFDTLNHELLMNHLRKNIHDKRVTELIKRYTAVYRTVRTVV